MFRTCRRALRLGLLAAAPFAALPFVAAPLGAQAGPAARADSLLSRLEGRWRMRGVVQGDSVAYTLDAERALDRRFVVLRMKDVQVPAQYEAHVYIGVDSATTRVIAHWMDVFGAGSSIPHAEGAVRGDTLTLLFRYASGDFRDTFAWDPRRDAWHVLLESADGKGGWSRFAEYRATRR